MCIDSLFLSSEEFSKVHEESLDKISEASNQPDKTGNACTYSHTHEAGFPLGLFLAGQMSGNNLFYRTNLKLTGHVSIIRIRIV